MLFRSIFSNAVLNIPHGYCGTSQHLGLQKVRFVWKKKSYTCTLISWHMHSIFWFLLWSNFLLQKSKFSGRFCRHTSSIIPIKTNEFINAGRRYPRWKSIQRCLNVIIFPINFYILSGCLMGWFFHFKVF